MSKVIVEISVSLDGYAAGPDASMDEPLGIGGMLLHDWAINLESWREAHGYEGGETNRDSDVIDELRERVGAYIMGRKMFSGGEGSWQSDPNADAWWGDDPPFHEPVFILTHHERETEEKDGGTTFNFVTDGIESALAQARAAAGEKDVQISGGADVIQQYLRAGHVDELRLHVAPVFLGGGRRLFEEHVGDAPATLERIDAISSPSGVVHLIYGKPTPATD